MKRLIFVLFFVFLFINLHGRSSAVTNPSAETKVKASVGKFYFTVSGFVSPFASVVLYTNSIFMGSTVADAGGNFIIRDVLVNEGFSQFCLEAIDVKRIGDSYTCFTIPPLKSSREVRDIFLPPTLGLSGREIKLGSKVIASGYSMPGALVNVAIGSGLFIKVKSDLSGFYKTEIKNLPVGKYELAATAFYKNRDSEKPNRTKELTSLSVIDIIKRNLPLLLLILVVLTTIILLIILFRKRIRKWIERLRKGREIAKGGKNTPLHHRWFVGY